MSKLVIAHLWLQVPLYILSLQQSACHFAGLKKARYLKLQYLLIFLCNLTFLYYPTFHLHTDKAPIVLYNYHVVHSTFCY